MLQRRVTTRPCITCAVTVRSTRDRLGSSVRHAITPPPCRRTTSLPGLPESSASPGDCPAAAGLRRPCGGSRRRTRHPVTRRHRVITPPRRLYAGALPPSSPARPGPAVPCGHVVAGRRARPAARACPAWARGAVGSAWAWPAAGPGVAGRVRAWGVPADSPVTPVTGARSPAPHANSEPAAGPAPGHRAGVGRVAAGPAPGGAGPLAK